MKAGQSQINLIKWTTLVMPQMSNITMKIMINKEITMNLKSSKLCKQMINR